MVLQISPASNLEEITGYLTELEATQVPFATVLALNRTAAEAQTTIKEELPQKFTLRRDWVSQGLRLQVATKGRPVALVFTKDWFMEDQETGAERTPTKAPTLFAPTKVVRAGEDLSGEIPADLRPKALMRQIKQGGRPRRGQIGPQMASMPKPFIAKFSGGRTGLFIRRGKDRLPIVLLYTLKDAIKIKPRWGFDATTAGVSDKVLRREFIKALDEALKSAKGGPIHSAYVSHLAEHGSLDFYGGGSTATALPGSVLSALER